MDDNAYVGEIRIFSGEYVPQGWLLCDGKEYTRQEFRSLFAVIGDTYGGNGSTTFLLPDLCGRAACGPATASTLISTSIGGYDGAAETVLTRENIPTHTHTLACNSDVAVGTLNTPADNYISAGQADRSTGRSSNTRFATTSDDSQMGLKSLSSVGLTKAAPVNVMQRSLSMLFMICVDGAYPYGKME